MALGSPGWTALPLVAGATAAPGPQTDRPARLQLEPPPPPGSSDIVLELLAPTQPRVSASLMLTLCSGSGASQWLCSQAHLLGADI